MCICIPSYLHMVYIWTFIGQIHNSMRFMMKILLLLNCHGTLLHILQLHQVSGFTFFTHYTLSPPKVKKWKFSLIIISRFHRTVSLACLCLAFMFYFLVTTLAIVYIHFAFPSDNWSTVLLVRKWNYLLIIDWCWTRSTYLVLHGESTSSLLHSYQLLVFQFIHVNIKRLSPIRISEQCLFCFIARRF